MILKRQRARIARARGVRPQDFGTIEVSVDSGSCAIWGRYLSLDQLFCDYPGSHVTYDQSCHQDPITRSARRNELTFVDQWTQDVDRRLDPSDITGIASYQCTWMPISSRALISHVCSKKCLSMLVACHIYIIHFTSMHARIFSPSLSTRSAKSTL